MKFDVWIDGVTDERGDLGIEAQGVMAVVYSRSTEHGAALLLHAPVQIEDRREWPRGTISKALAELEGAGLVTDLSYEESTKTIRYTPVCAT